MLVCADVYGRLVYVCALRCSVPFSAAGVEKQKWHHVGVFEWMRKRNPLFSFFLAPDTNMFQHVFLVSINQTFVYWFSIQLVKLLNALSSLNYICLSVFVKHNACPKKRSFNGKVKIDRWWRIQFRSHLLNLGLGHQKQRRSGDGSIHPVGNDRCSLGPRKLFSESFLVDGLEHLYFSIYLE